MTPKAAADLARDALLFICERPDDVSRFLTESGAEASELRARAEDPAFLGFTLDFLMAEEERAREFCEGEKVSPEKLFAARAALPGGDAPHWT